MKDKDSWEQKGAATGILAAVLFAIGIAMGLGAAAQSPPPDLANAESAPLFMALGLTQVRFMAFFTILGFAVFLWFMGSLWMRLKQAEGEPARGSTIALLGAATGTALIVGGLVITAAAALSASPTQANVVPALYVVSALSVAIGAGMLSVFFFSVSRVIFATGVLGRWLGWLAVLVGLLCALAFTTPFFDTGPLDAATGALGRYAWFIGLVVWVLATSVVLTRDELRRARAQTPPDEPDTTEPATRGSEPATTEPASTSPAPRYELADTMDK